jgi:hypothetical protein
MTDRLRTPGTDRLTVEAEGTIAWELIDRLGPNSEDGPGPAFDAGPDPDPAFDADPDPELTADPWTSPFVELLRFAPDIAEGTGLMAWGFPVDAEGDAGSVDFERGKTYIVAEVLNP